MKIDSCLIIKNEENNIERLIKQLLMFSNEIHITDTGSTDNTINIINNLMSSFNNIFLHYFEWCDDFSKARNYSLTCYECNADYQFWCDGDDELNDILIDTLRNFDGNDDAYICNYLYNVSLNFIHQRISLINVKTNLVWKDPIHEYLDILNEHIVNSSLFDNGSLIIHNKTDELLHRQRNLNIYKNMEKNHYNFSCRNRYYYGVELYYDNLYEYAAYQFMKCIDDKEFNQIDKINACKYLLSLNKEIALQYFYKLFSEEDYIRKDLFYAVGNYFFNKEYYELSKFYYILCINCEEPNEELLFFYDKKCHINSLLQLGIIEYNKGNIDLFAKYNKDILEIDKDNETAKYNLSLLNEK